jgi:hypothetical protein
MMPRSLPIILFLSFFLLVVPCFSDSSLNVLVTDGQNPVGGATVSVLIGGSTYSGLTDSNGLTSFSLPNGTFSFVANKDGYLQGSAMANGGDSNATIRLTHLYSISGTIVDASTGLPVKSASITVTNKATQDYYTSSTDSLGVFNVQTPNGYYGITVRSPDYRLATNDNNGAGYQVLNNALYVGYIPIVLLSDTTGGLEGVDLSTDFPGKTVKANSSVSFDVTIKNNGIVDKTYSLAVKDAPSNWNVEFLSGSDQINKVFVASKGSRTFQVKTTPLAKGSNTITIMAAQGSDNCSLQLFVDTTNETGYGLEFSLPDNITLNTGASSNVDITVKNNGSVKLTNVAIDIPSDGIPSSLTANIVTQQLDELDPGESHTFTITVGANANANQESDKLYIRATSSETKTDQKYIEVNTVKSSTWVGVGIAIALIAILAFGFIVWKYGRR